MIQYLKHNVKNAKIKNNLLIEPLPTIQVGYKVLTNIEEINIYMYKFPKQSVLHSMINKKIRLIVK